MTEAEHQITMHLQCLVSGLLEHECPPLNAPPPCRDCALQLGRARVQASALLKNNEDNEDNEAGAAGAAGAATGENARESGRTTPRPPGTQDQPTAEGPWQCAERGWRCGVRHGSRKAAENHSRRLGGAHARELEGHSLAAADHRRHMARTSSTKIKGQPDHLQPLNARTSNRKGGYSHMTALSTTIAHILLRELERAKGAGSPDRTAAALRVAGRLTTDRDGYNDSFSQFTRLWMPDGSRLEFIKGYQGKLEAHCAGSRPEEEESTSITLAGDPASTPPSQPELTLEQIRHIFEEARNAADTEPGLGLAAAAQLEHINATRQLDRARQAEIERQAVEMMAHLDETGECPTVREPDSMLLELCDIPYIQDKTTILKQAIRLLEQGPDQPDQ